MPSFLSYAKLRRLRRAVLVCVFAVASAAGPMLAERAPSHTGRAQHAAAQYRHAQALERHLLARPQNAGTQKEYTAVLDAYRAVYHGDPAAADAPKSVDAVASLLQMEGRQFGSTKDFRDAIGQYEFLRKQYPTSPLRHHALLTEAAIERNDLHDAHAAARLDREFLRLYPHNALAEQARADLNEDRNAVARPATQPTASQHALRFPASKFDDRPGNSLRPVRRQPVTTVGADRPTPHAGPPMTTGLAQTAERPARLRKAITQTAGTQTAITRTATTPPATLESVRYWSTDSYTRVAMDLDHAVAYQSSRTEQQPDRIVFHLLNTDLSKGPRQQPVLVRNDHFLQAIRVQAEAGNAVRVTLEVSNTSDYSAFLLPNPDRLIIDIHASRPGRTRPAVQVASTMPVAHVFPAMSAVSTAPVRAAASSAVHAQGTALASMTRPLEGTKAASDPEERPALPLPATPPMRPTSVVAHTPALNGTSQDEATNAAASRTAQVPSFLAVHPSIPASQTVASVGHAENAVAQPTNSPVIPEAKAPVIPGRGSMDTPETMPLSRNMPEGSLSRVLGLKVHRIVIDAGHGGHDSGTLGPHGLEEKNVVLDVALRLGRLLQDRLGAEVVYTRRDDTFVPLETRTAIANQAQADLFISIHANSSRDRSVRGVETYFLNFTSSPSALAVAARENAASDNSEYELSDLVRKIALSDKVDESRTFAVDVQRSLYEGLEQGNPGMHDRGVKQAPFVVLIGANMPSILAEISFLTNPQDAAKLRKPAYRQRIAEALYRGVAGYVRGMGGVRVAENHTRPGR